MVVHEQSLSCHWWLAPVRECNYWVSEECSGSFLLLSPTGCGPPPSQEQSKTNDIAGGGALHKTTTWGGLVSPGLHIYLAEHLHNVSHQQDEVATPAPVLQRTSGSMGYPVSLQSQPRVAHRPSKTLIASGPSGMSGYFAESVRVYGAFGLVKVIS